MAFGASSFHKPTTTGGDPQSPVIELSKAHRIEGNEGSEGDEPKLANPKLLMRPPDSHDRIDFRRDGGGYCNTNLEEDYRPAIQATEESSIRMVLSCYHKRRRVGQSSASRDRANPQRNIGHHRRCDNDDDENCSPIAGIDAKQGKDKGVVRPPRGKRHRVNTSAPITRRTGPKRQTVLTV
ncbi:hypothetical protein C7999DRAFT_33669 [Corynascus novoguineensis]|uniref:Uncharacterized protein n=1 Tax=Corynascus novoguineensis TaxID=1126955 RepID=A0AAN7CQC9_9PEZI|nr:hypothetical protein C7999DRAFT_33669 [Corynascus novoguineensis]